MFSPIRDLRFVIRSLWKSPVFTVVAILSLSLGVGANTAIFTLVDQVLLRSLPVQNPEEIVMIATRGAHPGNNRGSNALSYPMFKDYREKNEVFSGVMARRREIVNLGVERATERADAEMVSGNYFEVLGLRPAHGRLFGKGDETAKGANAVVILSHDYWRNRFDADPSIIGKSVRINEHPMQVVGVAPAGFTGVSLGDQIDLFVPVTMQSQVTPGQDDLDNRRSRWLQVYARLKAGVTIDRAQAQIRTLHKQIIQEEAKESSLANITPFNLQRFLESYAIVIPGGQGYSGMRNSLEKPLKVLFGLVVFLLLITCVNVSNLLVARGAARQKEISVRLALGAGRRRILAHLLSESLVLALISGVVGLAVAFFTVQGLLLLAPNDETRVALSAIPDWRILGFNFIASTLAALIFGLAPAWQATRTSVSSVLKDQAGSIAGGAGTRLRKVLVVAQVALCFLLLIGSGLFVQSLSNLENLDPGFSARNVIRFKIDPTLSGYTPERTKAFYADMQQRLQRLPGIESMGFAVVSIMEGDEWDSTVKVEGYTSEDGENMNPHFNSISPGYFKTMNIPIKAGRDFEEKDFKSPVKVGIVNETFAKRYFKDRSPVGYHFGFGGNPKEPADIEIIAVVGDAKYEDLNGEIPRQIFVLNQQQTWASQMTGYVRTTRPSVEAFSTVRQAVAEVDATLPLFDMNTMEDQLDRSLSLQRLVAYLSAAFGFLATALCIIGLYGVTAYTVARRMREFGVLMAFGAQSGDVIGKVLKECALLAVIGICIGFPLVWWLSGFVENQLFGVAARDPYIYAGVALLLLSVAAIAGIMPAWRASRISPWIVLRYE